MPEPAGPFVPTIGAPDPGVLEWINSVWGEIPAGYLVTRPRTNPVPLRQLVREEAEGVRKRAPFRAFVLGHVEAATGKRYTPAAVAAGGAS